MIAVDHCSSTETIRNPGVLLCLGLQKPKKDSGLRISFTVHWNKYKIIQAFLSTDFMEDKRMNFGCLLGNKIVLSFLCVFSTVLEPNRSITHAVIEFVLLGFSGHKEMQNLLFFLILVVYILTLLGNGAIVCAVKWDKRLHTPMYILLGNFAFLEIWYVSSTVPNMLANFLSETKTISFFGCFFQFYLFFSLGTTECFFLSVMAYDRYLAICRPLHYPTIMTGRFCATLISGCWVSGFLCYPVPIVLISQLPFCGPYIIDHFVCDPGPLFALTCVPAPAIKLICYTFNSMIIFGPFLSILGSYTLVLRAVLRIPSGAGRHKAFSTCGSHLVVVSLFYGTLMVMYVSPTSGNPSGMQKIVTLVYSVVTPLLNPLIYSLRNKDMKNALRKVLEELKINQSS
ncbi:olfactory receptor 11H6-like [Macrotis lagotis]|uniref:olfactory receptor 11H6-like n=1 Tax=Macrotis lagotis TaxID=92651 RepID=UPI003D693005